MGVGARGFSAALVMSAIAGIGGQGAGLRAIGGDESMQTSAASGRHGQSLAEAYNHPHRGFAAPRGFR
jgi:hypothetical protein